MCLLRGGEEANLTERKNMHTPVYGVKEFVCLSVIMGTQNGNFTKDFLIFDLTKTKNHSKKVCKVKNDITMIPYVTRTPNSEPRG